MEAQSYTPQLVIVVCLVVLAAFFSASETAFTSLGHLKRKKVISEKKVNAVFVEKLFSHPGKMLTTILLGSTMVNILASVVATFIFSQWLPTVGIKSETMIGAITMIVMTTLLLIFGEITPKMIAIRNNEKLASWFSRPVYYVSILFLPLVEILNFVSTILIKITRGKSLEKHSLVSEEEIKLLINMGLQEGLLEEEEEKMLTSIFEFGEIVVREIMTPRTSIVALEEKTPARKVVKIIQHHWHSRIPVYSERMDNMVGFVYAKDMLSMDNEKLDSPTYLKTILRPPFFVPESKRIDELLKEMRKEHKHIAMVVDEYGGISGLVTIEDIIEEIVGEIQDEYDTDEDENIKKISDQVYLISGLMNVSDLNEELSLQIHEADSYDSIGGFMVEHLGKLPAKGGVYEDEYVKMIILNVQKRRITRVRLEIKQGGDQDRES